jgi:GrpB-like predicted nucleotidyltransferase (UPF0157 family)
VPNMLAKPIIDMDVLLGSEAELLASIDCLAKIGYTHRGNLGTLLSLKLSLHLNTMFHITSMFLRQAFRDYLPIQKMQWRMPI